MTLRGYIALLLAILIFGISAGATGEALSVTSAATLLSTLKTTVDWDHLADYDFDLNFGTHLSRLVDVFTASPLQVENGNAYVRMRPYSAMIIVADDIVNTEPEDENPVEDKDTEIVVGAKYRHFKGNEYEVIAVARHSETMEELVVYKSLKDGEVWARPKAMFVGKSGEVRRFTKLD